MVDALRKAHRIAGPDGLVVDVHPCPSLAAVEAGTRLTGYVHAADGRDRHATAARAIATVVADGLFAIEHRAEFDFSTYADTIEELRDYIEEHWRDAHLDEDTVARTREMVRETPGARPRARERVALTILRPR